MSKNEIIVALLGASHHEVRMMMIEKVEFWMINMLWDMIDENGLEKPEVRSEIEL